MVATPEAAAGGALNEREGGMLTNRVAQAFELAVDSTPAGGRRELHGVEEEIDVLGKALYQVPGFRETGSALEYCLRREMRCDDAEHLGDEIVFLDKLLGETW